jgi:hypothetical protein
MLSHFLIGNDFIEYLVELGTLRAPRLVAAEAGELQGRLENSFVHAAFSRFARCCFLQALFNQFRRHLLSACLYWMRLEYSTRRGLYSAITLPCAGAPMPNWHYNA